MEDHPIAGIFPLLQDAELHQLANDIAENGLREPIWLYEGKILDGRNRYRACQLVHVEPATRVYEGTEPVSFVVSLNLHRRHLNDKQRTLVAAKIADLNRGTNQHTPIGGTSQAQAAELLNVSERGVSRAKQILQSGTDELQAVVAGGQISIAAAADVAELPGQEQREVVARGEKEILQKAKEIRAGRVQKSRESRAERLAEISRQNQELTGKKLYRIIYADPPWKYGDTRDGLEGYSAAVDHYPAMTIQELCELPVKGLAAPDAALFLWVTSPLLYEAAPVIEAWGFKYKASFVWDKVKHNVGHYNSVRHEFLLVCTRGSCVPDERKLFDSVVEVERGEHSAKPEAFREIIDTLYTTGDKLELFRRGSAPAGWDVWGNQSDAA